MHIPVFTRLAWGGLQVPSGRIANIINAGQHDHGKPVVTLRYADNGDEVMVTKAWLNRAAKAA
jgi:hypothetical protein